MNLRHLTALTALLVTVLAGAPVQSADLNLPDMGSPSDGLLSLRTEAILGRQVYSELLETGSVITDPELQEYIQDTGMRLVAHADSKPGQRFTFFVVESPLINAFALPGGYIGVHTGLLLAAETESELAGVLAHEISHVTQRHISRAVFANQRASTISLATMLGAILAGVAAGAGGDVMAGAISMSQSMAIENRIAFTRANEYEADRVAVEVMAGAGFDPMGMPNFFETLSRRSSTLSREIPTFLRTHPVTSARVAETRARARALIVDDVEETAGFELARARSRLLTSSRPEVALEYFTSERSRAGNQSDLEYDYGEALALTQLGRYNEAEELFADLLTEYEEIIPLHSALAETQIMLNQRDTALDTFANAMALFPDNLPLTVRYAEALLRYDRPQQAHDMLLELLNKVPPTLEQVRLIALAANRAGDVANTHYYMAEYQAMSGNLRLAIDQLVLALGTPGLDSVQRARMDARLKEFQEYLPRRRNNTAQTQDNEPEN